MSRKRSFLLLGLICAFLITVTSLWQSYSFYKGKSELDRTILSSLIGDSLRENLWPRTLSVFKNGTEEKIEVHYTINSELQSSMESLLRRYKPDYGALVAMDARDGKILAMVSYTRDETELGNLSLKATFPAASVFKVVTAAAAIDKHNISPHLKIPFNGGYYTLYKRNVLKSDTNRWTRRMSIKEAFGKSINTVFGKLGLNYLDPEDLLEYAHRFKFNEEIFADFPVERGIAHVPQEKSFEIAEVASGFNRTNRMSPIQGAMIAAAVANDGVMMAPHIVDAVYDEAGERIYDGQAIQSTVAINSSSAKKLRLLMEETVERGTTKKIFRDVVRNRRFSEVEFGGKTGSLTGDEPRGRTDWFVGYARYQKMRLAVAAVTVNKEKWTVRSAYLAKMAMKNVLNQQREVTAQHKTR